MPAVVRNWLGSQVRQVVSVFFCVPGVRPNTSRVNVCPLLDVCVTTDDDDPTLIGSGPSANELPATTPLSTLYTLYLYPLEKSRRREEGGLYCRLVAGLTHSFVLLGLCCAV